MADTAAAVAGTSAGPSSSSSTSGGKNKAQIQAERMKRLRQLHLQRNEARQLNHQEVKEEERRMNLPANHDAKLRRAEWILQDEARREAAEATGQDYDRVKLLNVQADELERQARTRGKKKNPDEGFSTYEHAAIRQHKRLVGALKVDMAAYEKEKEAVGEDTFYAERNTIIHGVHQDTPEAIDRMVTDLKGQMDKREKFSRRRAHNDEADIDYINERNMKFNKKLERFYGKYTSDIKQDLERGTAI